MLKKSNQGFALIPVIAIISVLSIGGYFSYNYFFNTSLEPLALNTTEDNVLQAAAGPDTSISDFIYKNLFKVSNKDAFNKADTAIVLKKGDWSGVSPCSFLTRGATPLKVSYQDMNKVVSVSIYSNVMIHNLSPEPDTSKYLAVIPTSNTPIKFKDPNSLLSNNCTPKILLIRQPSGEITAESFQALLDVKTLVKPQPISSLPNSGSKSGISYSANITQLVNAAGKVDIIVNPTSDTLQKNDLIYQYFKNRGIVVVIKTADGKGKPVNYKTVTCIGKCTDGFKVSLPLTKANIIDIQLPQVANNIKYEAKSNSCEMLKNVSNCKSTTN